jgi:hypothetical protein
MYILIKPSREKVKIGGVAWHFDDIETIGGKRRWSSISLDQFEFENLLLIIVLRYCIGTTVYNVQPLRKKA